MSVRAVVEMTCDLCHNGFAKTDIVVSAERFNRLFHKTPCWESAIGVDSVANTINVLGITNEFVELTYNQLVNRLADTNIQITFPVE